MLPPPGWCVTLSFVCVVVELQFSNQHTKNSWTYKYQKNNYLTSRHEAQPPICLIFRWISFVVSQRWARSLWRAFPCEQSFAIATSRSWRWCCLRPACDLPCRASPLWAWRSWTRHEIAVFSASSCSCSTFEISQQFSQVYIDKTHTKTILYSTSCFLHCCSCSLP